MMPPTETDPTGRSAHAPGAKLDSGKAPITRGVVRQSPRAMEAIAHLTQYGAEKYSWQGWAEVPDGVNRYADARGRHEVAIGRGEEVDDDSGCLHLTAVAWNALAELELKLRQSEEHTKRSGVIPMGSDFILREARASRRLDGETQSELSSH